MRRLCLSILIYHGIWLLSVSPEISRGLKDVYYGTKTKRLAYSRALIAQGKTLAGAIEMYQVDYPDDVKISLVDLDNFSKIDDSTLHALVEKGYIQGLPGHRFMKDLRTYQGAFEEGKILRRALYSYNTVNNLAVWPMGGIRNIDRGSLIALKQQGYLDHVPSPYVMEMLNNPHGAISKQAFPHELWPRGAERQYQITEAVFSGYFPQDSWFL